MKVVEIDEIPQAVQEVPTLLSGELKKLVLHSSHYLTGLVGGLAVGMVSFPIFTRIFTVAEYGVMDLAQRIVAMLVIGSKLGLQNAALRFYSEPAFAKDAAAERSYYSTMFFGALAISMMVGVVFVTCGRINPDILGVGPISALTYLIVILAAVRAVTAMLLAFLRIEERTKLFNGTMVGSRAGTVVVVCALLEWTRRSVQTYFSGVLLVESTVMAGLCSLLVRRQLLRAGSFQLATFRAAVVYGLPLVFYEFAFAVLGTADRFLVRHYLNSQALGFYSVAYSLAQHANDLLVMPLTLAIVPIYMRIWSSHGAEQTTAFLSLCVDLSIMVAGGILAVIAVSAHDMVVILASSKYDGVDRLIPVILAGLLVYALHVFVAAGLLIYKRTMQMAGLLVVAAALNISLNCLLLPRMGLFGGALATLISYAVCILLLAGASRRLLPLDIDARSLLRCAAAAGLAWLVATQLRIGPPIFNLPLRGALTLGLYLGTLCVLDRRVRHTARLSAAWVRNLA